MTRRKRVRIAMALICALVFVTGGYLVVEGLRETPPGETPTPDQEFSISAKEALAIDRADANEPLEIAVDTDFGPFVNTEPVIVPAADSAVTDGAVTDGAVESGNPPNHLYIPSLFVSAPVVPQGVTSSNEMSLPADLHQVGLLDTTSPLGAEEGSTLIAGHVTQQGDHGALFFLGKIRPGATVVTVDEAGAHTTWVVTSARNYRKSSLPEEIFETAGSRTLTLVTCGGEIIRTDDGRWTHTDNIVVTATRVPQQKG